MKVRAAPSWIALAAALLAAPAHAEDICVDPDEAGCEDTIQAGVDAAEPGQVVKVAKGNYQENVIITTEGITLEGKGKDKTIIRAPAVGGGTGIVVNGAPNVTIRGLTVRTEAGHAIFITASSDNPTLDKVKLTHAGINCIVSGADNIYVKDSWIGSCLSACISVTTNGFVMTNSTVSGCGGDFGVRVTGDGTIIEKSEITRAESGRCLLLVGDNGTVTDNEIGNCAGNGIEYGIGDNPWIDGNEIWAAQGDGIFVICPEPGCTAGRVANNEVRDTGAGIHLVAGAFDGSSVFTIEKNDVDHASGVGIGVQGNGVSVVKNQVEACGSSSEENDCFSLQGDDLLVEKNSARGCAGDGFDLAGDASTYEKNSARKNVEDGFDLAGDLFEDGLSTGNAFDGNKARGNGNHGLQLSGVVGDGFEAGSVDTALARNKAKGNLRADLCDAGLDTIDDGGNKFGTVDEARGPDGDCLDY